MFLGLYGAGKQLVQNAPHRAVGTNAQFIPRSYYESVSGCGTERYRKTHGLVHKLVDPASIPSRSVRDVQRHDVVVVHLQTPDIDVGLQVALVLPLAAGVSVECRIRARAELAPVDQVSLPTVGVDEPLEHKEASESLDTLDGSLEDLKGNLVCR